MKYMWITLLLLIIPSQNNLGISMMMTAQLMWKSIMKDVTFVTPDKNVLVCFLSFG